MVTEKEVITLEIVVNYLKKINDQIPHSMTDEESEQKLGLRESRKWLETVIRLEKDRQWHLEND